MSSSFLFTSESVSEGHPDKVSDQISDAVLDALLTQDKNSRVGAETLCNTGLVVLAGEITTKAVVDFHQITRDVIKNIGYDNSDYGIDYKGCAVLVAYDKQSPDIAQGVDEGKGLNLEQGAGDQGMMFGYACTETDSLMPLPIYLSHRLVEKQAQLRKSGKLKWLRPDAKSQVTVKYVDGKPAEIDTIVLSTQHHPEVEHKHIEQAVIEEIIKPVLAGLPRVIRVNIRTDKSGEWLENTLLHAVDQAAAAAPGSRVIIAHMAEVLFAEVLRRYLLSLPAGRTGWLAGAGDPAVGRALAILHRRPCEDWTLESLAREVGLSRSALNEKFTKFLGQAPMTYLTEWRLELGAEALRSTSRSVQQVAVEVGYDSEAAFNRAFKRKFALPPARYRRESRAW